jgi:hypothetical protein
MQLFNLQEYNYFSHELLRFLRNFAIGRLFRCYRWGDSNGGCMSEGVLIGLSSFLFVIRRIWWFGLGRSISRTQKFNPRLYISLLEPQLFANTQLLYVMYVLNFKSCGGCAANVFSKGGGIKFWVGSCKRGNFVKTPTREWLFAEWRRMRTEPSFLAALSLVHGSHDLFRNYEHQ